MAGTLSGVSGSIGSAAGKAGDAVGTVAKKASTAALVGTAAAAGVAGGLALRSRTPSRPKVAGVPMPGAGRMRSVARDVQQVGREIGKAGFRLGIGDVNMEVRSGGRKEKRTSPLEVLLEGLTNRRSQR